MQQCLTLRGRSGFARAILVLVMKTAHVVLSISALLVGCVGMSAPTASTTSGLYGELEKDVNRLGSDFRDFDLDQADPDLCRAACDEDVKCKAWTYVHPGWQGEKARCWLKDPVPLPRNEEPCCVSGVKPE
jgi:hypothetical protein